MDPVRLLLVDDEAAFRETMVKRMKRRGITPFEAGSGEDALALLEKEQIDIIVMDVKMPGLNGIETLRRIKENYSFQKEVILLTGQASTEDGVEGIKSGAFDYLAKPVEFEHLMNKVSQANEKIIAYNEKLKNADFRKKLEHKLITTERLASLGTLAAGVAHEINNPLAIISESIGWIETLLKKPECENISNKENFIKTIDKIKKSVERAKKITHQLLGYSRKIDYVAKEFDLTELINEILQLTGNEAKIRDIELTMKINLDDTLVWCDPSQLRQVLINLVTNGIQAVVSKGRLIITVTGDKDDVNISVTDTGPGIPKENFERIFEPFFTTKPPSEGTGLGLSVSKNIIENLGGKIEVESILGVSTTFNVKIPRFCKILELQNEDTSGSWDDLIKNYCRRNNND